MSDYVHSWHHGFYCKTKVITMQRNLSCIFIQNMWGMSLCICQNLTQDGHSPKPELRHSVSSLNIYTINLGHYFHFSTRHYTNSYINQVDLMHPCPRLASATLFWGSRNPCWLLQWPKSGQYMESKYSSAPIFPFNTTWECDQPQTNFWLWSSWVDHGC